MNNINYFTDLDIGSTSLPFIYLMSATVTIKHITDLVDNLTSSNYMLELFGDFTARKKITIIEYDKINWNFKYGYFAHDDHHKIMYSNRIPPLNEGPTFLISDIKNSNLTLVNQFKKNLINNKYKNIIIYTNI